MDSFNLKTWFAAILIAAPLCSQTTRKFPQPVGVETLCDHNWFQALVRGDADYWMVLAPSFRSPSGVYVAKEIRSGTTPGESVRYIAHYTEAKLTHAGSKHEERVEATQLSAELPAEVASSLNAAWKAILRQTRYQDPTVKNGVISEIVDGESFFFGYGRRYFGMNQGLVTDEAWLIQNLGTELMKYVKSTPQERLVCMERIQRLLKEFEQSSISRLSQ